MSSTYIARKKTDAGNINTGTAKKQNIVSEGKAARRSAGGIGSVSKEHLERNVRKLNSTYAEVPGVARVRTRNLPDTNTKTVNKKRVRLAESEKIKRKKSEVVLPSGRKSYDTVKIKAAKAFPVGAVLCVALVAVAIMFCVNQYIKFDSLNESLDEIEAQIASTNESITLLEVQYEQKYDLNEIERIATEEYGMVNADSLPRKYITLTGDDVIELVDSGDENSAGGVIMSGLGKTLYKIVEYLR